MKRVSIIGIIALLLSLSCLQGQAQFWISFGWNEPHCQNCLWMEQAIRLTARQAAEYHQIIHKYGQKIEKEARREYRYWDKSAEKIYKLRMERDRKLQHILSPSQFRLYVRFVREAPTRIHDWRGWFNNPNYPNYHPSSSCHRYEDHYWHCRWEYTGNKWFDRFDDGKWYPGKYERPGQDNGQWHPGKYERPQARPGQVRPNGNNSQHKPGQLNRPDHRKDHRPATARPGTVRPGKDKNGNVGKDKKDGKTDRDKVDRKRPGTNRTGKGNPRQAATGSRNV